MNILFLVNRYIGVGGIENVTRCLAENFTLQLGHKVSIYSLIKEKDISEKPFMIEDVDIVIDGATEKEKQIKNFSSYCQTKQIDIIIFQDSYAEIEYLLETVDRKHIKIIVVEHNTPNCLLMSYINSLKARKWYTIGGSLRYLKAPYNLAKIYLHCKERHSQLVALADKYILLSNAYIGMMKSFYGIVSSNICAITNPIQVVSTSTMEFKRRNNTNNGKAIFVGRLNAQKGIHFLINIWTLIEKSIPDWSLTIVGDGEERTFIEQEIQKRGLKRIRLVGHQLNVAPYYQEASIFLMTSIFEGLPLVLPEAMHYGCIPFVFDSFKSLHDIIDNEVGFIIPSFNIKTYAHQVIRFASLSVLEQDALREKAILRSERFIPHTVVNKWQDLFDEIKYNQK